MQRTETTTSSSKRAGWTFAITSTALFMTALDNLVVTTALPTIRRHLHATIGGLEWTIAAYTLTFAALLLTGSSLGERFGRRRMFLVGLTIFTLGSAAAALAPGIAALVAARAMQGIGGAIVTPLTLYAAGKCRCTRTASPCSGGLGRDRRAGRGERPTGRRGDSRVGILAVDLLAERADRSRPCPSGLCPPRGEQRQGPAS